MKNARFWVFENGDWVKLTLRPWKPLRWGTFERHEEGWSRYTVEWTHEESGVLRESASEGTDCDGKHGEYQEDFCPLESLSAVAVTQIRGNWDAPELPTLDEKGAPMFRPKWQDRGARAYDQFAEAAGY